MYTDEVKPIILRGLSNSPGTKTALTIQLNIKRRCLVQLQGIGQDFKAEWQNKGTQRKLGAIFIYGRHHYVHLTTILINSVFTKRSCTVFVNILQLGLKEKSSMKIDK